MATVTVAENTKGIDPDRLYSVGEAVRFIPSPRGGRTHPHTLYRWLVAGRVAGVRRVVGLKTYWFVRGADLLRLIGEPFEPAPAPRSRSPRRRREAVARARKAMESL